MSKKEDNKISPVNRFNILWVNIQVIMTILVVIFLILSFVSSKKYFLGMEVCMGLDLLVMAYNNYLIYKRKNVTVMYAIIGVLVLVYALLGFIGVI